MKKNREVTYSEPVDYIPKELRKKYKLGEFADEEEDEEEKKKSK